MGWKCCGVLWSGVDVMERHRMGDWITFTQVGDEVLGAEVCEHRVHSVAADGKAAVWSCELRGGRGKRIEQWQRRLDTRMDGVRHGARGP